MQCRILIAVVALAACKVREGRPAVDAPLAATDSIALSRTADSLETLFHRLHSDSNSESPAPDSAAVGVLWHEANRRIADITARTSASPGREWLVGNVYYAGWDLDLPGAFDSAEAHLSRAVMLDSTFLPARFSLARLYVNSGPGLAAKAERLLREARVTPGSAEEATIHEGLAFALYYQGRAREAATEAALVLAHDSTNLAMRMLRDAYASKQRSPGRK